MNDVAINRESGGTLTVLDAIEYRIAAHMQGAYQNLLAVGQCLNDAKDAKLVPHGQWEEWVRRNTGFGERQAQKLMQAARSVQPGSAMERLPISKIQAILSLPEPEREGMAEKAASEDMSLRALQEEIKAAQRRAEKAEGLNAGLLEKQRESERRAAEAEKKAAETARAEAAERYQAALAAEKERLLTLYHMQSQEQERKIAELAASLEEAKKADDDGQGTNEAGQMEIARLQAELKEAEEYAERQAELRQKAQDELLAMQSQAARGELDSPDDTMTAANLAAAVRAFVGAVGVMPHMGAALAGLNSNDREEMRQYIDMVAAWVDGARGALDTLNCEI